MQSILDDSPALLYDACNGFNESLIQAAVVTGTSEMQEFLTASGAVYTIYDSATVGSFSRLEALLSAAPELLNQPSEAGWTPLHLAAVHGHDDLVDLLLQHGADPNIRSANGAKTPLHLASDNREFGSVSLLLKGGADPNARDSEGRTPLHLAARNADMESVQILIACGADREVRSNDGNTPGMLAREMTHDAVAELLEMPGRETT